MPADSSVRHFLSLKDFTPEELNHLVERAIELKALRARGTLYEPLKHKTLAMLFELASTRTRVAFEVAMHQLGGHAIFLAPETTQLGRGEPVTDTAKVLSEMVDIVMIRAKSHQHVEDYSACSKVPVINAMTDRFHPCQLLADVQTFCELRGSIENASVAFIGDGYNMCNSYINAAVQFGFNLRVATPVGYEPDDDVVAAAGNHVTVTHEPQEAVRNADLVVTDVWASMGHEEQHQGRLNDFDGFQVDTGLLDGANSDALFMHCLPAKRGEEVSATLFEDDRSVVWQEAGNRMHSQKALLEFLIAG